MKDFLMRLTSRKFLITLASGYLLYANKQWNELVVLVSAYLASEGAGDIVERFQNGKTEQAQINKETVQIEQTGGLIDDVDTSSIVAGQDTDIAM